VSATSFNHIQKHETQSINRGKSLVSAYDAKVRRGGALTRRWKAGRKERALWAQERRQRQAEAARRRERTSRRERMVARTAEGSAASIAGAGAAGSIGSGEDMEVDGLGGGGGEFGGREERSGGGFLRAKPWLLRGSFLSDQLGPARRMVRHGGWCLP
jgi:hypothetical protein